MLRYAMVLCAFYAATKLMVRWWWFRPTHARPAFLRHNEAIRVFDLLAILALIAAFFLMVNTSRNLARTIVLTLGLLAYDLLLRAFFLHLEIRRLCLSSRKWTYRNARRQILRRGRNPTG